MTANSTEIRVKGRAKWVPTVNINGRTVITAGNWLKIASIQDENLLEGEIVPDPASFVEQLRKKKVNADLLTFAQKLPFTTPQYRYHFEWDNLAVIPLTTYDGWWERSVEASVRRAVRKATKLGVVVRPTEFNKQLVDGIVRINNETPVRQGKLFWHYQKPFEEVMAENSTFASRNEFIGAYYFDELIGFMRLTYVDGSAHIVQLLSKMAHFEKRPANALIAKAVEVCINRGISNLVYCNFVYNDPNSSLTEFKKRNGFQKVLLPRYYIALTFRGKLALNAKLHRGLIPLIPKPLLIAAQHARNRWYESKSKRDFS
jgi:hypothetical protein